MKVLIYSPFRCGSSFVTRFFGRNLNTKASFLYDEDFESAVLCKMHDEPVEQISSLSFDYIVTCIRKPTEIFMSAYIKDLKTKGYPYFYDKEFTMDNMDDVVNRFLQFNWENYNRCSYDFNFSQIKKLSKIDIWKEKFDVDSGVSCYDSLNYPSVIVVTHQTLFDEKLFHNFKNFAETRLFFKNTNFGNFSYRNQDVYGELYDVFKQRIPQYFFDKYKHLDNIIVDKFYRPNLSTI